MYLYHVKRNINNPESEASYLTNYLFIHIYKANTMTIFFPKPRLIKETDIRKLFLFTFLYMNTGVKKEKLLKLHDESISYILNDV